jgi:GNAT superfamily N-acetyltransferase
MSTTLRLRQSQVSDGPGIASLFAYTCKETYSPFFPQPLLDRYTPTKQLERWTTHLRTLSAEHRIIVATDYDEILGFVEVGPSGQERIGEIHYLFVHPKSARVGVGTALLRSGELWLYEQGYRACQLWVFCENKKARQFYKKERWEESNIVQDEPSLSRAGYSVPECKLRKDILARNTD